MQAYTEVRAFLMKYLVFSLFCCACLSGVTGFGEEIAWGESKNGLAVRLLPSVCRFYENDDMSTNEHSRLDFELEVKNVSGKPLMLRNPAESGNQADTLEWEIRNKQGELFRPTFVPPPMPSPGSKPSSVATVLQPDEILNYTAIHGVSGFTKEGDNSRQSVMMLPVGDYELVIKNLRVAGSSETFVSNKVKITVLASSVGKNNPSQALPESP